MWGCLSPTGLPLPQRSWGASAPRLSPPSHIPLGSPVILLVSLYHRSSCGPRAPYPTGIPPPHMPIPLCPRDPQGISALQIPLCLQGPLGFLSPCSSPPSSGCLQDHEVPATCPMWSFHTSPQILLMCLCPIDLFMAQGPSAPSWPKGCSRLQP